MAYPSLARRLKFLIDNTRRYGLGHAVEVLRQAGRRYLYARKTLAQRTSKSTPLPSIEQSENLLARARQLTGLRGDGLTRVLAAYGSTPGRDTIVADADRFLAGSFTSLGYSTLADGSPHRWRHDPIADHEWSADHFSRINWNARGTDPRRTWEINRLAWIHWLGAAYHLTGEERYAEGFRRQISSWFSDNPVNQGPNWTVAMEASIRAVSLLYGAAWFGSSPSISREWMATYFARLREHRAFISGMLEYFPNLTNHYISNLMGLVALDALFDNSAGLTGTSGRIAIECHRQTTAGFNYECSLPYHGLVLEMLMISRALLARSGVSVSRRDLRVIDETISAMVARTQEVCNPVTGVVPRIGDCDDGLILRASAESDPYRQIWLAEVLSDPSHPEPRALLLDSDHVLSQILSRKQTVRTERRAAIFSCLRSSSLNVVCDTGDIGLHGNNDPLSFTVSDSTGIEWIVDRGTGSYLGDVGLRYLLHSIRSHNTPTLDRQEPATLTGVWRVDRSDIGASVDSLQELSDGGKLVCSHRAFRRGPLGIPRVERSIDLKGDRLEVVDRIEGDGDHTLSTIFTIPGEHRCRAISSREIEIVAAGGTAMKVEASEEVRLVRTFLSPSYGILTPCWGIEVEVAVGLPAEIGYLFRLSHQTQE